jgi:mono/diheme cytochrome c family protein
MLKQRTIALGALLCVPSTLFLLTPGVGATRNHDAGATAASADAPSQPEVKGLYGKFCLQCHGSDGKAKDMKPIMPAIPDFTNREWQQGVSDVQLKISILEGKGPMMPGLRDRLSDEESQALVVYVREFVPPPPKAK